MSTDGGDYTRQAVAAIRSAVRDEKSFPEWLASVLATVVSDHELGGYALISGRPGSWEAHLVWRLIAGTVGEDGGRLSQYRRFPGGPDDPRRASSTG
jgi:hypothetical protein